MSALDSTASPQRPDQEPLGRLVGDLTQDVSSLIRDEMALAKAEISDSVKKAGIGAGLFGAAGVIALHGLGALVATAILGLALVIDAWLAALIITIVLFAIAAVVALVGKKEVAQATPPLDATRASVRKDITTATGGTP